LGAQSSMITEAMREQAYCHWKPRQRRWLDSDDE